jgi:short-subunit dehydrogenase
VNTEFFELAERADSNLAFQSPDFFKVTAREVARTALQAVIRDKARVIPGPIVALVMAAAALVPIFVLRHFLTQPRRQNGRLRTAALSQ